MDFLYLYTKYMSRLRNFFLAQMIVPFETGTAFYCVYGGLAGLLKWGLTSTSFAEGIGEAWAIAFNIWYLIAGLFIFFGIGLRNKPVEVFGLVSMISSLLLRSAVISWVNGLDTLVVGLYTINAIFISMCLTRIYTLFKYIVFVQVIDETKGHQIMGVVK